VSNFTLEHHANLSVIESALVAVYIEAYEDRLREKFLSEDTFAARIRRHSLLRGGNVSWQRMKESPRASYMDTPWKLTDRGGLDFR
jgi:hypothetical protein